MSNSQESKESINVTHIATGWFNTMRSALGILPPDIEEMAKDRLDVCNTCDIRNGYFCGSCGCPLIAITKTPNKNCPLKKWKT